MVVKRRNMRTRRKSRRQRGGVLDCEAEGFTYEMRLASGGTNYNVGSIHEDGESWTFDKAVEMNNQGMVEWYCQKVGLTREESEKVKAMTIVQELGAFFLRYKVVAERFGKLRQHLEAPEEHVIPKVQRALAKLKEYVKGGEKHDSFLAMDMPIEVAIDRTQCLLWYIIKHKGAVPPGFVMDARISEKAKKSLSNLPYDLRSIGSIYLAIPVLEKESADLRDPPVTFGVF